MVIDKPKQTGQPCPWGLWLQNEDAPEVFEFIEGAMYPIFRLPEAMVMSREVIHCGDSPDRDYILGLDLVATHPRDADMGVTGSHELGSGMLSTTDN